MRCKFPKTWLRNLYFTFIFNNIYYCAEVYGNTNQSILRPLQIVQNQELRILQFRNKFYPVNEMHKAFKILKVSDIVEYKLQKCIHSIPRSFHGLILRTDNLHSHSTRNRSLINRVREKQNGSGSRQIKCQPSKKFNHLPTAIQTCQSHSSFKTLFYDWKLSSYEDSVLNFAPNMF